MPIYEYQCTSCHHHFDLIQKINAEPVKQCPMCFDNSVIKLVSAPGFQLKGTGWYETDFKNKGKTTKETNDKKEDRAKSTDTAVTEGASTKNANSTDSTQSAQSKTNTSDTSTTTKSTKPTKGDTE